MIQANAKIAHMIIGRMTHCTVVAMKSAMTFFPFAAKRNLGERACRRLDTAVATPVLSLDFG